MFKSSLDTATDLKNGPAKDSTEDSSQNPVGIWSTMLKSVGSVNSTPTGTLLILGMNWAKFLATFMCSIY